jgi:hypothetical protein
MLRGLEWEGQQDLLFDNYLTSVRYKCRQMFDTELASSRS